MPTISPAPSVHHCRRRAVAAALAVATAIAATAAAQRPIDRLIVLEKAAATASLFDPATRKEIAKVPVGDGPHEVAVAPDGRTAVVCNYGDRIPGSTLTVIDVAAAKAIATIELRLPAAGPEGKERTLLRPHGIRYLPDGTHVVVTSEQSRCLAVVDVAARTVARTLPTTQPQLHMVALAPDAKTAFGTSVRDGTLGIFDLAAAKPDQATVLTTGDGAEGLAVRPGTGEVWVGNRAADAISVVDAQRREIVATLSTAALPIRVEFTPDGAHALVSCADAGQVQVFAAERRELARTIDLLGDKTEQSPLPIGICIDPDGKTAWVACMRGEFLAVIDIAAGTLLDRVPAGPGPDGMAWARWTPAAAAPAAADK